NVADAKLTIERFSSLLRYQLYDPHQMVSLDQELQHLQNFIDLQRVRVSKKLQLEVHFEAGCDKYSMYPLLLLPLVENAFKYVGGKYRIQIEASVKNNFLFFKVTNSIPAQIKKGGGIGLQNLRRRLHLLYEGSHEFSARENGDYFEAFLKLQLQIHEVHQLHHHR
ncbi:MAG TPA: histidine kinase, partial [Flavisolibacter sp.]|nr:histidine kinase [Flavisolibacter sp.]